MDALLTELAHVHAGSAAVLPTEGLTPIAADDLARELIASWRANAAGWTDAVRSGLIASRRLVTDRAVVEAVMRRAPRSVLDLGCGEGWLCRALAVRTETVVGVDVSAELLARARELGGARFAMASYAELAAHPHQVGGPFDVIVANFALLDRNLIPLLRSLASVLSATGAVIIQTVHPSSVPPPYEDGWRQEDFSGFGGGVGWRAMPWYFRTTATWLNEISSVLDIVLVEEPPHPQTRKPASLLITAARG